MQSFIIDVVNEKDIHLLRLLVERLGLSLRPTEKPESNPNIKKEKPAPEKLKPEILTKPFNSTPSGRKEVIAKGVPSMTEERLTEMLDWVQESRQDRPLPNR